MEYDAPPVDRVVALPGPTGRYPIGRGGEVGTADTAARCDRIELNVIAFDPGTLLGIYALRPLYEPVATVHT